MSPYIPFAALPLAVTAAWFAASHWTGSDSGRYQVPPVAQLEEPAIPAAASLQPAAKSSIRVAAFLPYVPPVPPVPNPVMVLHSVMTGAEMDLATINGVILREGEMINGYRVHRITASGVDLVKAGQVRRLPMRPLHELPEPRALANDAHRMALLRENRTDPNEEFWEEFGSRQP